MFVWVPRGSPHVPGTCLRAPRRRPISVVGPQESRVEVVDLGLSRRSLRETQSVPRDLPVLINLPTYTLPLE